MSKSNKQQRTRRARWVVASLAGLALSAGMVSLVLPACQSRTGNVETAQARDENGRYRYADQSAAALQGQPNAEGSSLRGGGKDDDGRVWKDTDGDLRPDTRFTELPRHSGESGEPSRFGTVISGVGQAVTPQSPPEPGTAGNRVEAEGSLVNEDRLSQATEADAAAPAYKDTAKSLRGQSSVSEDVTSVGEELNAKVGDNKRLPSLSRVGVGRFNMQTDPTELGVLFNGNSTSDNRADDKEKNATASGGGIAGLPALVGDQVDVVTSLTKPDPDTQRELQQRIDTYRAEAQVQIQQAAERGWTGRNADELWIIEKPRADLPPNPLDEGPGCGALICRLPGQTVDIPVPLRHTDVKAHVLGYISSVNVTQSFHNPYASKIEAVYVFPLPQNSAVSDFLMTVGDRTIRGIIREREEAVRIYNQAKAQGHVASLLTQQRANIFTQKVANIEPGKQIDINITYFNTLEYYDGEYELVFPMVVGPRFNPPGSTDGVAAVARGAQPGAGGQATQISYLRPEERSGHDISLEVTLNAGVSIESIRSRSHAIDIQNDVSDPSKAIIKLSSFDTIPNRDFVLRWKVAGDTVKTAALVQTTDRGTFMSLMIVPPASLESCKRGPVEMVFVLDCSGSMSGTPMQQAKAALIRGLRTLQQGDSFQIIRFSNNASQLGEYPLEANKANIEEGVRYAKQLSGSGGTMMIEGIKASLGFPHDPERTRYVVFLTDGYIGNENEILAAVHDNLGPARVFSFGVGNSTNRLLMHRMAKLGRGVVAFLGLNDSATDVMDLFMERTSRAALTNISIDLPSRETPAIYPSRLPDVFVGRPVVISMQLSNAFDGPFTVRGRAGGEELVFNVTPQPIAGDGKALAQVWARAQITEYMDRSIWDRDPTLPSAIRETALAYGMMSQFTSFVAVDSLSMTQGQFGTTIAVPVPVPEGVKYQTTVTGR